MDKKVVGKESILETRIEFERGKDQGHSAERASILKAEEKGYWIWELTDHYYFYNVHFRKFWGMKLDCIFQQRM